MITKCVECGREYALNDKENPTNFSCECGGNLTTDKPVKEKIPILALILSFFLPGLGQLYNRHFEKGIILIIISLPLSFLFSYQILKIIFLVIWIFGMFDAYDSANRMNKGKPVNKSFKDYF